MKLQTNNALLGSIVLCGACFAPQRYVNESVSGGSINRGAKPFTVNERLVALCEALDSTSKSGWEKASVATETLRTELAEPTVPFIGLGGGIIDSDYELYNMMIAIFNKKGDSAFAAGISDQLTQSRGSPVEPYLILAEYVFSGSVELRDESVNRLLSSYLDTSHGIRLSTLRAMGNGASTRALELVPGALIDQTGLYLTEHWGWMCLSWQRAQVIVRALSGTATSVPRETVLGGSWDLREPVRRVVAEYLSASSDSGEPAERCRRQLCGLLMCNLQAFREAFDAQRSALPESITAEMQWHLDVAALLDDLEVDGQASTEDELVSVMSNADLSRWKWALQAIAARRSKVHSGVVSKWLSDRKSNPESLLSSGETAVLLTLAGIRSGVEVSEEDKARVVAVGVLSDVEGPDGFFIDDTRGELISGEEGE
jgi:hypothetical protein